MTATTRSRLSAALPAGLVVRRLGGTLGLLAVLSVAVFALLQAAPGDPAQTLLGPRSATPEALAAVRARHHLDSPMAVQYWYWLSDAVRLDLGTSIRTGESVATALGDRLVLTGQLVGLGFAVALLLGIPLGVLAGLRNRRVTDRAVQSLGVVALSTPAFAGGLVLIYVFSLMLGWFPAYGPGEGAGTDRLRHLVLAGPGARTRRDRRPAETDPGGGDPGTRPGTRHVRPRPGCGSGTSCCGTCCAAPSSPSSPASG